MTALDLSRDPEFPLRRRRWTAAEVEHLCNQGFFDDGPRYELLDGELIEMSPPGPMHAMLQTELLNWIFRRLPETLKASAAGPIRLSLHHEPEPDIYLFPAAINVNAVRGPDAELVIEVSHASRQRDLSLKADIYRSQGVRLYWVIDVEKGATWVHEPPDGYADPLRVAFAEPLRVPGVAEPLVIANLLA